LKRLVIAVAALVTAAFATLIGLSILIPAATVREAVKREIKAVTGLDPTLRGGVSVSLFPHATVTFRDVLLGGDANKEPAVVAGELIARLRYFPLLAGRVEIADVMLVRPAININLTPDGASNWSGLAASLAHAVAPASQPRASFSEIAIHDGTIAVHRAGSAHVEQLGNVEFQVAWPSISRSFAANGRFVWHDQPVDASLTLGDFLAALTGRQTGVKFRLTAAPLKVVFDGTGSNQPTLKLDGILNVDSPSLRDAMMWTGNSKVPFGGFGRFALRAQSGIVGNVISLPNVDVELDGNKAEGGLTLSTDGHRTVQGTLAADSLDLTPYVSGVRLSASNSPSWDRLPITLDGLADFDLDLRLSAANIKVAKAQFGRTALAANMRGGKLNVTIGESQAFGGSATGSFGLGSVPSGVEVSSHVQFTDVDLAKCLSQLFGLHVVEGRGTFALDVTGAGNSVLAITRTLDGKASLQASDGALTGFNVEELLRRLERQPLSGNGNFRNGRTPFDTLVLSVKIREGVASISDLHIGSPALRLAVVGQASIPSRDLDLAGKATLVSNTTGNAFELPFVVQGPWDYPIVLPDASSLIRHSQAAAPLLEAVKKNSAGDAVRSVINQLFSAPPPGTPGAPAEPGPLPTTPASESTPAAAPAQ
jgi:AsmA protein